MQFYPLDEEEEEDDLEQQLQLDQVVFLMQSLVANQLAFSSQSQEAILLLPVASLEMGGEEGNEA